MFIVLCLCVFLLCTRRVTVSSAEDLDKMSSNWIPTNRYTFSGAMSSSRHHQFRQHKPQQQQFLHISPTAAVADDYFNRNNHMYNVNNVGGCFFYNVQYQQQPSNTWLTVMPPHPFGKFDYNSLSLYYFLN